MRTYDDDEGDEMLSRKEAARYLSVSVSTLDRWRDRGEGPPRIEMSSRTKRYRRKDLDRFIEDRRR